MHAGVPPRVGSSSFFIADEIFCWQERVWVGKPSRIASRQS